MVCNIPQEPWKGAEIYCSLDAPSNFPDTPPKNLIYYTPNGLFVASPKERGPVCVSIGEFHPEKWRKVVGMHGFILNGIVNAFVCYQAVENSGGIRVLKRPNDVRKLLAKQSKNYNQDHNSYIHKIFEAFIKSHPELEAVKRLVKIRMGADPADLTKDNVSETSSSTDTLSSASESAACPLSRKSENKKEEPRSPANKEDPTPPTQLSTENSTNNTDKPEKVLEDLSDYVDELLDDM